MGMLLFILLSAEFFIPMRQLGSLFHVAMNGISASDELFSYLELEEPTYGQQEKLSSKMLVEITGQSITASYGQDDSFSLKPMSFQLKKGTFTAVIGKSGSGKSTLVKLLTGELQPISGSIKWNNDLLSDLSQELIHQELVVINNHSYVYATTLKENLLLGNEQATVEDMWQVLDKVNLKEFVQQQDKQLEMSLDENGQNLSGGQRQRVILARALLKKSQFYLFDEITSGVDIESENNILRVVKELAAESIVFFISHRLYNVLDADQILVFDQGALIDSGSPNDLLNESTYFKTYFEEEKQEKGEIRE